MTDNVAVAVQLEESNCACSWSTCIGFYPRFVLFRVTTLVAPGSDESRERVLNGQDAITSSNTGCNNSMSFANSDFAKSSLDGAGSVLS
mgnify:CR=1 FL=1